ncbi:MAG: sigma-70 family RNA polymerase sigma factor [Deltaproteobacteria bacterium]|nr:sigma-70 family RNA polymerase sigma factor [Deltaproteobacteria bacterium]
MTETCLLEPEHWVERHGDVLFRYALRRLGDAHQAENVVQEALLAALEGQGRFSGRSTERTWLVGILKHKVLDIFRRGRRAGEVEDIETAADQALDDAFDGRGHWVSGPARWSQPDKAMESRQFLQVLTLCLEGLTQVQAQAFTLREMDGLQTEEICKVLGVSTTHLGVLLHRARGRLRSCLEGRWFAGAEVG